MAYIISRTEEDALEHLSAAWENQSVETTEAAFDLLTTIYVDPHQQEKDREEFRSLKMTWKQEFNDFLTRFRHLATQAKVPKSMWISEINSKLYGSLRLQAAYAFSLQPTFEQYVSTLSILARAGVLAREERENSKTARPTQPKATASSATPRPATHTSTYIKKEVEKGTTGLTARQIDEEDQRLREERRCFVCKKVGHRAWECPDKGSTAPARVSEVTTEDNEELEKE